MVVVKRALGALVIAMSLAQISCYAASDKDSAAAVEVSLYTLLTQPTNFDGKLVSVEGYICLKPDRMAIFLSYRGCDESTDKIGIGVNASKEVVLMREQYGHQSYGKIQGTFHVPKDNTVAIDSAWAGPSIDSTGIQSETRAYVWSFPVLESLDQKTPEYVAAKDIQQRFAASVAKKDYEALAKVFAPNPRANMKPYVSDLSNPHSRLGWVFFGAPRSIYAALAKSNFDKLEVYRIQGGEQGDFLMCMSSSSGAVSFEPSVSYLLEGGDKFCFSVGKDESIDYGDFLYL